MSQSYPRTLVRCSYLWQIELRFTYEQSKTLFTHHHRSRIQFLFPNQRLSNFNKNYGKKLIIVLSKKVLALLLWGTPQTSWWLKFTMLCSCWEDRQLLYQGRKESIIIWLHYINNNAIKYKRFHSQQQWKYLLLMAGNHPECFSAVRSESLLQGYSL